MHAREGGAHDGGAGAWAFRLLALGIAVAVLWRLGVVVAGQLAFPYDIGNESFVLCSIQALQRGLPLYSPRTYDDVPFALTIYTPLYHALVAALPAAAGAPFLTGRLVAMAAMLLAACAVFAVARSPRRLALPALALGWFFLQWPALVHTAYLRHDSLALALSAWAVVLVARGGRAAIVASAVLSCLAIATKQTYVAASLTCAVYLLLTDRRGAALYAGVLVTLLAAGGLAASLAWGAGFWFCTLVAPSGNTFAGTLPPVIDQVLLQPVFVALALASVVVAGLAFRRDGRATLRRSPYLIYVAASLAVCALTIGRTGSNELYVLEIVLAQLLWLVFELGARGAAALGRAGSAAAVGGVVLLAALELATPGSRWEHVAHGRDDWTERADYYAAVRAGLAKRGVEYASVLNLGAMRDGFGIADRVYLNDSFIYGVLWKSGRLDPATLVAAVQRRDFDVVLLPAAVPMPPDALPDRPLKAVAQTVFDRYVLAGRDASNQFYVRP